MSSFYSKLNMGKSSFLITVIQKFTGASTGGTKCAGGVFINQKSKKNLIENYSKPVETAFDQWVLLESQNIVLSGSFYEKVQYNRLSKNYFFLGATIDFFAKQCPANPYNVEDRVSNRVGA